MEATRQPLEERTTADELRPRPERLAWLLMVSSCSPLIVAGLAVLYLGVALLLPAGQFFSGDSGIRYLQVSSAATRRALTAGLPYPAAGLDPDGTFRPDQTFVHDGQITGLYPVAFTLVTLPFYLLFGAHGLVLPPVIGGIGCLVALFAYRPLLPGRYFSLLLVLIGAGTPVLVYSVTFWEHTVALALALAGIGLLFVPGRDQRLWRPFLAGLLLGLSTWFRPEQALLLALATTIYVATTRREQWRLLGPFALAGAALVGALLITNLLLFDRPLGPQTTTAASDAVAGGAIPISANLHRLLPYPKLGLAWLGCAIAFIAGTLVASQRAARLRDCSVAVAALAALGAAVKGFRDGLPYTHPGDLFGVAPLALLGLGSIAWWWRERRTATAGPLARLWLLWLLYALALALLTPAAGPQWGARYFLLAYPLLVLGAVWVIAQPAEYSRGFRPALVGGFALLALVSVLNQGWGVQVVRQSLAAHAAICDATERLPDEYILTDWGAYPQVLAACGYQQRKILVLRDEKNYQDAVQRLRERGVHDALFLHWDGTTYQVSGWHEGSAATSGTTARTEPAFPADLHLVALHFGD